MKKKTKKVFTRKEALFSLNSSTDLRSDAHQSQIIEGVVDKDHTQIVGEYTVKLLGDIPPIPPGFGTPVFTAPLDKSSQQAYSYII